MSVVHIWVLLLVTMQILDSPRSVQAHTTTLIAQYERSVDNDGELEFTSGTIYFMYPNMMHLVVLKPERQHIQVFDNKMTIYFPQHRKLFIIHSKHSIELPLLPAFLLATKEDYGLSDQGYRLRGYRREADTIETTWEPIQVEGNVSRRAILRNLGKKVLSIEVDDMDKHSHVSVALDSFTRTPDNEWFPQMILLTKQSDKLVYREVVVLKEIQFNRVLPDSVVGFQVPEGTDRKDIDW